MIALRFHVTDFNTKNLLPDSISINMREFTVTRINRDEELRERLRR
ncbi:hypothetical protein Vdis_1055 [Vulcanisaeta distributa DSM 14429]|uniref:Uncharacterized protein n=1 Tax=Vulcanisaeta distributa (strain DSM 14429 / JCM 11212 / NBRC 100878 / IC-017) TaxID=572478 RepID=E1QQE9_VULDI|nr:hypothetical protein Vdis_1055 [Vulcanisaeta distributa DSM 14429]